MTRVFKFAFAEHEEHGTKGWKPDWIPGGEPLTGIGVAHDVMEHWTNQSGSWNDELVALGAALFVRGDGGWFAANGRSKHNDRWSVNTCSDIVEGMRKHVWQDEPWVSLLSGRAGSHRLDEWNESEIEHCLNRVRQDFREEVGEDFNRAQWMVSDLYMQQMARLMRVGYRKAERRYRNAYAAAHVFSQIAEKSDKLLEHADDFETLEVRLNARTLDYSVRRVYPEADSWD